MLGWLQLSRIRHCETGSFFFYDETNTAQLAQQQGCVFVVVSEGTGRVSFLTESTLYTEEDISTTCVGEQPAHAGPFSDVDSVEGFDEPGIRWQEDEIHCTNCKAEGPNLWGWADGEAECSKEERHLQAAGELERARQGALCLHLSG